MRILIDECMPGRDVGQMLVEHDCKTVQKAGFSSVKNGELLDLVDDNLSYQQNFIYRRVSLLIIRSKSNRIEDIIRYVPAVLAAFRSIKPEQVVRVSEK